jgi:hypothetical protein
MSSLTLNRTHIAHLQSMPIIVNISYLFRIYRPVKFFFGVCACVIVVMYGTLHHDHTNRDVHDDDNVFRCHIDDHDEPSTNGSLQQQHPSVLLLLLPVAVAGYHCLNPQSYVICIMLH